MAHVSRETSDECALLPQHWRDVTQPALETGEQVLAFFEPDLNADLRYSRSLVVLTNRRLLATQAELVTDIKRPITATQWHWQSWDLANSTDLRSSQVHGLGTLELNGSDRRLEVWRFTAAHSIAANRLTQQYHTAMRSARGEAEPVASSTVCPSCGATLAPGETDCPVCQAPLEAVSTHSLLRLARFARPRAKLIGIGFALTWATTAVGLIPPYLTMPLVDKFLIPLQSETGKPPWWLGLQYFIGLLVAAVATWLLAYARNWYVAKAGERVSSDIRVATYSHLQRLSLEYFGGKRTGDLMSRIGSDSDRICNFLSVHLLDFANDVLMIIMTTVILISIDAKLALATLLPFPFIAWLIQRLRGRLRMGYARGNRAWSEMVSVLADTIPGVRVVKAFAQESREIERFQRADHHVVDSNDRVNNLYSFFNPTVTLLTEMGSLVVWIIGAWLIFHEQVTVGTLLAFSAYIGRFYVRLESMSRMIASTQRAAAATHRIFEILDRVPSVAEPVKPLHPGRVEGEIELRNISFQYGARRVLHNIS
ncbi:MAG TPA: ABC transporter transmembrane domain-containing protein, partial [Pirellulaceae bacterium]|nr:ABC transporter transmembrane domain-containing protein [Pirellulaceae bacterium]